MFSNETYSFLYGLFHYIGPCLTVWYVYLYFIKLYPRMARASLMAQTYRRDPSAVGSITNKDVVVHALIIQTITSIALKLIEKRKKD